MKIIMLSLADIFGLHTEHLTTLQMSARAVVVFMAGLAVIRCAGVRTLGRMTAFDQLTLLVIGSILGRSVISGQNFFGALLATLLITLLQRVMAWLTYRSKRLGKIFKGEPVKLMHEGRKLTDHMADALVTDEDIEEAVHTHLQQQDTDGVKDIYMERSGHISFVKEDSKS